MSNYKTAEEPDPHQDVLLAVEVRSDLHEPLALDLTDCSHVLFAGENKFMVHHPAGHHLFILALTVWHRMGN